MNHFHHLFAQSDGIPLRNEYDPSEGIGNDKDREAVGIREFHRVGNHTRNLAVLIRSERDGRR